MTTTTATSKNLKPGQIVRANGIDNYGTDLTKYRKVHAVESIGFGDRLITFTDGTTARVGGAREFQIATHRQIPTVLDVIACLLAAYTAATA